MATEIIRPNSYITRSSVNIHDSDDAYTYYQVVNEEVANDSSYIYTRSNAQYVVMGLSNPTTVSGTIVNVALYARCWHENAAIVGYYNVGCFLSGTTYNSTAQNTTITPTLYVQNWPTNPRTGVAWVLSDINDLGYVITLDGKWTWTGDCDTFCSHAYAVISFTPTSLYFIRRLMKVKQIS